MRNTKPKLIVKSYLINEIWFKEKMHFLKLIAKTPKLEKVLETIKSTHKSKYNNILHNWIEDEFNPSEWLDRILKIDCLIEIEDQNGQKFKVAIDVTANNEPERLNKKLTEIGQPSFKTARNNLGIDRHWVVILPNSCDNLSAYTLSDKFYEEIDSKNEIAVINFK